MRAKLQDGSVVVAGTVTSVKALKHVGEKQSALKELSIAAGKNKDTTTVFVTLKAWRGLAHYADMAQKGDAVCAVGRLESREYSGKTYTDLICEWMNIATVAQVVRAPQPAAVPQDAFPQTSFAEIDDDGDLPF